MFSTPRGVPRRCRPRSSESKPPAAVQVRDAATRCRSQAAGAAPRGPTGGRHAPRSPRGGLAARRSDAGLDAPSPRRAPDTDEPGGGPEFARPRAEARRSLAPRVQSGPSLETDRGPPQVDARPYPDGSNAVSNRCVTVSGRAGSEEREGGASVPVWGQHPPDPDRSGFLDEAAANPGLALRLRVAPHGEHARMAAPSGPWQTIAVSAGLPAGRLAATARRQADVRRWLTQPRGRDPGSGPGRRRPAARPGSLIRQSRNRELANREADVSLKPQRV